MLTNNNTSPIQSLKTDHAHLSVQLSMATGSSQVGALVARIEKNESEQERYNTLFDL